MKLLFDENFGQPLVTAIKGLVKFARDPVEIVHIHELQYGGRSDAEWVPQLQSGEWIVLTCDRGKSAGPKLPRLCAAYCITHVLVSGRLHNSPQFEKARAVLAVWPEIMMLTQSPPEDSVLDEIQYGAKSGIGETRVRLTPKARALGTLSAKHQELPCRS